MRRGSPSHGSRARYLTGCRCAACGDANRRYLDDYKAGRRIEGRRTVPAWTVVEHIKTLRASGVELKAVARLSGFSVCHLRAVERGDFVRVTRRLNDAVMAVRPGDYSENARVPVAAALLILADLRESGVRPSDIARACGYRRAHFEVSRRRFVTKRTYRRLLVIAAASGARRQFDVLEVVA